MLTFLKYINIIRKFRSLKIIVFTKFVKTVAYFKTYFLVRKYCVKKITCPNCGNINKLIKYRFDRNFLPINGYQCKKCLLGWNSPFPTRKFSEIFYSSGLYRQLYKGEKQARKLSYDYGDFKSRIFKTILDKYIKKEFKNINGQISVLDYGCGAGTIIQEIKNSNVSFECYGFEPGSAMNKKLIKNVSIINLDQLSKLSFNLITSFHVLEHIPEYKEVFQMLSNCLKEEGILYLELPIINNYFSRHQWHVAHPIHYSKESIFSLIEANNLKLIKVFDEKNLLFSPKTALGFLCKKVNL